MKSSVKNLKLASLDELFSTEEMRQDQAKEKVERIPISELYPFKDHPFKIQDDEKMADMVESIKERGVLTPAVARPREDGGYELVAGHRRKRACELAGLESMPVIIRELDDDEAVLFMVDSNLQRETLLPSERAFAYKMKLDAVKRQGERSDLTSAQVVPKLTAREKVAQDAGVNRMEVTRYIRLTELIPPLLEMVDAKKIAFNPAVELSYLSPDEQHQLMDAMESEQSTPSLSQAQRLKKFSSNGDLTPEAMRAIMSEEKKPEQYKITIKSERLRDFFPKSYTPRQVEDTIFKLLEQWKRSRQREHEMAR